MAADPVKPASACGWISGEIPVLCAKGYGKRVRGGHQKRFSDKPEGEKSTVYLETYAPISENSGGAVEKSGTSVQKLKKLLLLLPFSYYNIEAMNLLR
jgi:hypothetical protein